MTVLRVSIPRPDFVDRFDAESIVKNFSTDSAMQAFSAGYSTLKSWAIERDLSLDKNTVVIHQLRGMDNGIDTLFGWIVEGWASKVKN